MGRRHVTLTDLLLYEMEQEEARAMSELLSGQQLAAIRARVEDINQPVLLSVDRALELAEEDRAVLLAAVDWLQAERQNLRAELENLIAAADATYVESLPYAGPGHTKVVGPFP